MSATSAALVALFFDAEVIDKFAVCNCCISLSIIVQSTRSLAHALARYISKFSCVFYVDLGVIWELIILHRAPSRVPRLACCAGSSLVLAFRTQQVARRFFCLKEIQRLF